MIEINKCPKCNYGKTDTDIFREEYYIVEVLETCAKCGNVKNHNAYGRVITENWLPDRKELNEEEIGSTPF